MRRFTRKEIKRRAIISLDVNEVISLPVDAMYITKKNKYYSFPYEYFLEEYNKKYPKKMISHKRLVSGFGNAFVVRVNNNKYINFYNQKADGTEINEAIAHEYAHIVLEHFTKNYVLCARDYEKEARLFVKEFLAPDVILDFAGITEKFEIMMECNITPTMAHEKSVKLAPEHIKSNQDQETLCAENQILKSFSNYIAKYKNRFNIQANG